MVDRPTTSGPNRCVAGSSQGHQARAAVGSRHPSPPPGTSGRVEACGQRTPELDDLAGCYSVVGLSEPLGPITPVISTKPQVEAGSDMGVSVTKPTYSLTVGVAVDE